MNEEFLTGIPEWAVEKMPFYGHVVEPEKDLEQMKKYIRLTPLYVEDGNKVLTLLDRYAVECSDAPNNADEPQQNKEGEKPLPKYPYSYVRPHVAEQDNTRITTPIVGPKSYVDEHAVRSVKGGFDVAVKQNKFAWQNLINEVKKYMTTDEEKRAEIDKKQEELSRQYEALPPTRDAATITATATNIVGVGLPMLIAGMFSPEVATVAGGGVILADIFSTYSQADMEMDAYERKTGKKLSKEQRTGYQIALTATNLIMNTMLGGNMLKGMTKSAQRALSKQIAKNIFDNPIAQEEFNTMTRRVLQSERSKRVEGALRSGVESGVTSGLMEVEKGIYTEEAPMLENIVASAMGGLVSGTVQSGVSSQIQSRLLHNDRMKSDELFYASDVDYKSEQARPISEIIPTDADMQRVQGETVNADKIGGVIDEYDLDNVVRGSYRKAMEDPWVRKDFDDIQIPKDRSEVYDKQWKKAQDMEDIDDTYELQNMIVQRMAADMGLPIQVYARIDDLPPHLAKIVRDENYGGITTKNGGAAIVLELCKGLSAHNVAALIRHELLGHKGMRRLYSNEEEYKNTIFEAGKDLLPEWMRTLPLDKKALINKTEERASLKTENRPYSPNGTPNKTQKEYENYEKLYDVLRRSEEAARQSTTNELRKNNYSIGGNPMPPIYNMELLDELFGSEYIDD